MKILYAILFSATITLAACADTAEEFISRLANEKPLYKWQANLQLSIPLKNKTTSNTVALGVGTKSIALVVAIPNAPDVFVEIPIDSGQQFGVCSAKHLSIKAILQSEAPLEALGEYPEGYERCATCFEIQVSDGDCDPIQFYWNKKTNSLGWWRA